MPPTPDAPAPAHRPTRLVSLDALRGFAMVWIIGGDVLGRSLEEFHGGAVSRMLARQFGHSDWAGFTFYDLIFPLFLFLVGTVIPFSLDRIVASVGRSGAVRRIAGRTALMFVLGVLFYGGLSHGLEQLRLLGVLQRLALCYGAVALLSLCLKPRSLAALTVVILLSYWALLTYVAVDGFGGGDYSREHNLAGWFDRRYLPFRLWYGDYDPEGLFSTLPAIATCLLGAIAGILLRTPTTSDRRRAGLLALTGVALLIGGHVWGLDFPVIKRLWTSTFVLVAAGWSFLLLASFHWLIDQRGLRRGIQPLVWVGTNAITIYLISHLVDFPDLVARVLGGEVSVFLDALWPGLAGLVRAICGIALCVGLCGFLYRRQLFLRL